MPVNMLARDYQSHDRSGNFIAWDYRFEDPWKKEIHKNEDEDQFSWKELGKLPPEDQGVYLFNSKIDY